MSPQQEEGYRLFCAQKILRYSIGFLIIIAAIQVYNIAYVLVYTHGRLQSVLHEDVCDHAAVDSRRAVLVLFLSKKAAAARERGLVFSGGLFGSDFGMVRRNHGV